MNTFVSFASELVTHHQVVATLLLIILGIGLHWLISRQLRDTPRDDDGVRRRWLNTARKLLNLLLFVGLIIIWLSELRFVALSIATFAVALVIATRELIQCVVGSLFQAGTRTYSVGDWVRIGDHTGEVVMSNWLSTTLLQVDLTGTAYSYTGRTLVVPNNVLVTSPIQNLNHMRRYVAHSFTLTRDAGPVNLFCLKAPLMARAEALCDPFRAVAERYSALIEKKLGVAILGPSADIRIGTSHLGKDEVVITLFCPTSQALELEQQMTEHFMTLWHEKLAAVKDKDKAT